MTTEPRIPNPDGMPSDQVRHIRCRPQQRGVSAHRPTADWRNGAENTLCGVPATIWDVLWADARHVKHRAIVNCATCVETRMAQGVAPQKAARQAVQ